MEAYRCGYDYPNEISNIKEKVESRTYIETINPTVGDNIKLQCN